MGWRDTYCLGVFSMEAERKSMPQKKSMTRVFPKVVFVLSLLLSLGLVEGCFWNYEIVETERGTYLQRKSWWKRTFFPFWLLGLGGCDSAPKEPSLDAVRNGCIRAFERDLGIPGSCLSATASRRGSRRWALRVTVTRFDGARRSLNVTAVLDRNGALHYYTE